MVHLYEFAQAVAVLDRITHPSAADRALASAGLKRDWVQNAQGFVPYVLEAKFLEAAARHTGYRHLGAMVGAAYYYRANRGYGDYVLGACNLASALLRGRRALPYLHPGCDVWVELQPPFVRLGFTSNLASVEGNRHLEEASVMIIISVCRHFLGPKWHPVLVELTSSPRANSTSVEELIKAPVKHGAQRASLTLRGNDLSALNPSPPLAGNAVTFHDLPALMGVQQTQTMEDIVKETLRFQFRAGDVSEDAVLHRLSLGRRNLQRALQQEGTTFRGLRAQYVRDRACDLLSDTDLAVEAIGRSLGYAEPKSFRRAFKSWTGRSPVSYRAMDRLVN